MQVLFYFIYSKLVFFFVFKIILAEVFVPLYTGRLLSSVAFKDKWEIFKYNLIMFVIVNFIGYEIKKNFYKSKIIDF